MTISIVADTQSNFLVNSAVMKMIHCEGVEEEGEEEKESLILVAGGNKVKVLQLDVALSSISFVGSILVAEEFCSVHSMDCLLGRFIMATCSTGNIYVFSIMLASSSQPSDVTEEVRSFLISWISQCTHRGKTHMFNIYRDQNSPIWSLIS